MHSYASKLFRLNLILINLIAQYIKPQILDLKIT